MSVFRRKRGATIDRVYSYEFQCRGETYRGSTKQITREAALQVDRREQDRARRIAEGLPVEARVTDTPRFQEWAETAYDVLSRRMKPERIEFLLRAVLKFWGAKPAKNSDVPIDPTAPYHDLRLGDVVRDPRWIERFEQWMVKRSLAPQTRNHYRSMTSTLYRLAIEPAFRRETGMLANPMAGIHRDRVVGRTVTITPDELRAWITHAPPHIKLAVAIGALAPTLRLQSILRLRWDEHVDFAGGAITVWQHKTASLTKAPQVWPLTPQLRTILLDAKRRAGTSPHVITFRGQPVTDIHGGVRAALLRAGLTPGRAGGITFHTLRHSAATELVRRHDIGQAKHALGHRSLETTLKYTHLIAADSLAPARALSRTYAGLAKLLTVGDSARTLDGRTRKQARKRAKPRDGRTA